MDEIRIGYFLEDIGQEDFLKALVNRVAREKGLPSGRLRHEVRNATGGRGKVIGELRSFLRDVSREQDKLFAMLVVAIDGNCRSYLERRNENTGRRRPKWLPGHRSLCCAQSSH